MSNKFHKLKTNNCKWFDENWHNWNGPQRDKFSDDMYIWDVIVITFDHWLTEQLGRTDRLPTD